MANYPDRCQHIKVNGVQCGSPALRRNRLCFFHKRFQSERIRLTADRRRHGVATFVLPVLEDANSIQMSIMQIMRLILTGQIEHKTASLLLYALQTANSNLHKTNFAPGMHDVILDQREAAITPLNYRAWEDHEFEDEDDEEELDEVELAVQKAKEQAEHVARFEAKERIKARERLQKRAKRLEEMRLWNETHPDQPERYIDEDGYEATRPRKPPVSVTAEQVRADIANMVRQNLPELKQAVLDVARREKDAKEKAKAT